jgi:hypothetical protein
MSSDRSITLPSNLQSALVGLDLNLDRELERYRHWRKTGKTYSYSDLAPQLTADTESEKSEKPELSLPTVAAIAQTDNPYILLDRAEKAESILPQPAQISEPTTIQPISNSQTRKNHPDKPEPGSNIKELLEIRNQNQNGNPLESKLNQSPTSQPEATQDPNLSFQDRLPEQTEELLQRLTTPPISNKNQGFNFISPLGILLLLALCGASGLLGYLLIDRVIGNKLLPPTQTPTTPQSSPNSSIPSNSSSSFSTESQDPLQDITKTSIPQTLPQTQIQTQLQLQAPQVAPSTFPTIPSLPVSPAIIPKPNLSSISTLLKPPVKLNQPAVSVRRYSAVPTWREKPASPENYLPEPTIQPRKSKVNSESVESVNSVRMGNPPLIMSTNPLRSKATSAVPPRYIQPPVIPAIAANSYTNNSSSSKRLANPPAIQSNPIENASVKYAPLVTATEPKQDKLYAIVAPNRYLAEGKQVEKEAFIRNNDGQIQLGSFRDAESAQRRIEELRKQGIPMDAIRVEAK